MTKAEMSQLQEVARKYSQYGYTLFEICDLLDEQPKEYSFKRRVNAVRYNLSHICVCSEFFTLEEMAELLEVDPEELWDYVKENDIEYRIIYTPKHRDKEQKAE